MLDIVEQLRIDEMPEDGQWEREARILMHRLLNDAAEEIERLRTKCNSQSRILRQLKPDGHAHLWCSFQSETEKTTGPDGNETRRLCDIDR